MISTTASGSAQDINKLVESTSVDLNNQTGHSVYVDAIVHGSIVPYHFGLLKPNYTVMIRVPSGVRTLPLSTDVYVYVKSEHTEDASKTICVAKKTFEANTDRAAYSEAVHYDGKRCWIAPR
ncbi:MAG: hypothetical protein KGN02_03680 [bacterium]|nr:hypothetical protein [bacterium]